MERDIKVTEQANTYMEGVRMSVTHRMLGVLATLWFMLLEQGCYSQSVGIISQPKTFMEIPSMASTFIISTGIEKSYSGLLMFRITSGTPIADLVVVIDSNNVVQHTVDFTGTALVFKTAGTNKISLTVSNGDEAIIYFGVSLSQIVMNLGCINRATNQYLQDGPAMAFPAYYKTITLNAGLMAYSPRVSYSFSEWMDHLDVAKMELLQAAKTNLLTSIFYDQQEFNLNRTIAPTYRNFVSKYPFPLLAENVLANTEFNFTADSLRIISPNYNHHTISLSPPAASTIHTYSINFKLLILPNLVNFFVVSSATPLDFIRISTDANFMLKLEVWNPATSAWLQAISTQPLYDSQIVELGVLVISGPSATSTKVYLLIDYIYDISLTVDLLPPLANGHKILFTLANSPTVKDANPLKLYSLKITEGGFFWSPVGGVSPARIVSFNGLDASENNFAYQCVSNKHLELNMACTDCTLGYYNNTQINQCSYCSPMCTECNNNFACVACNSGTFRAFDTCQPCSYNCSTCTKFADCTSCITGLILSEQRCNSISQTSGLLGSVAQTFKCNPECETCHTYPNWCGSCNMHDYLPYFFANTTQWQLTCIHRRSGLGKISNTYKLLDAFPLKFFPTMIPILTPNNQTNLLHKNYPSKLLRGWVKIRPDALTGNLHEGTHTIFRVTTNNPDVVGDDAQQIEHNLILLQFTYNATTDEVEFFVQFTTGTTSVGKQSFNLMSLGITSSQVIKNRCFYVGVCSAWITGSYSAHVIFDNYNFATNPTISGTDITQDIKNVFTFKVSSNNYIGSQLANSDFMSAQFYVRWGGYGKLNLFTNENDDDNQIDYKSWFVESADIHDSSYFLNHAMGKSVSEVLFRWIPIEHQYSDSLALGATAELTDNTINYNKIYIENVPDNINLLGWPGNSESGKTSYYAKANADLTKAPFIRSSVWMTTGTPFLLSFLIEDSVPRPKYNDAAGAVINKVVTFSCKGCQGGLPKIETFLESKAGTRLFYTVITLPGTPTPKVLESTKLVHIPGRVFTIAYERLLHSDIVTYKTFWNFGLASTFTAKSTFSGHVTGVTDPGDVPVEFELQIGDPDPAGNKFFGHMRNLTIFRDTTLQSHCEKYCLVCTKNFDCLLYDHFVNDSVALYDFKVHPLGCPIGTEKYAMQFPKVGVDYCNNHGDFMQVNTLHTVQNKIKQTYSPSYKCNKASAIETESFTIHNPPGPPQTYDWYIFSPATNNNPMGFYAPASVGATGGPQTIQHYVEIHRDMLLWPPGTDVTVSATLVSNGRVDPDSFVWHYYGRNISEDCSVNGPDVPDTDWIEDSVYVYYQLDFKVEVADTLKPQYIMIQLEKKRSPSQGVGNKVCPHKYYDETDPSKLYKKCVPKYVKKCHPMCSDCYGIKATMEYCIDCNLTVSDKIWTTADRSEFICVAKGTVSSAHMNPGLPDVFGCDVVTLGNIPMFHQPRYLASSFPYTCTTATPTSSLSLTPGVKFTYKKIKFLDSPIGDFVCPFSCALLKKFTKYTPVCANSDFVLILKSTKYRCCRYGTDEASCLSTCYDKPGSYPYQASICKTCAMGEVAVVSVVSATGEPLDSTCHPLSGPTPVPCKVRNQKMNLCYDCPSGFVGINYFSTEFTCTPCNFKFFDLTTQRYICLSSCNKFPYYYYDAVKKECMLCPTGTYYYPVTGICEATCPPGNFILSNTYCSNCLDPLMVNSPDCGVKCPITEYTLMVDSRVICVPVCPNYLYPDPVTRICTTCGTAPGTVLLDGICVTTGCPPGRFVNANLECLKCHPSCLTCSTTYDNCTSCISGYAFSVPNTFSVCYSCSIECLGCKPTYYRDCLQCVPPFTDYLNATDGTTLCKLNLCPAGTILHPSTGACAPCSFKYPGCSYCSASSCTSCQKNWQPWYIANSPLTPKLLYTSCRPCAQGTDSHTNFTVDSLTRRCIDICGDGVRHNERSAPDLLFYQECDDGNLIDGDGCSSNCTVEPNYVCKGGSWNSSDTCAHTKILEAKITNYDNNTAIVTIEFNDPITYNKSATEILKFKFTNMTEGEDYDWSVTTEKVDKFTKVYINIAPKVSFEKEEFVVYMDNFNIFGPKANALITYEIRFTIYQFAKVTGYDRFLSAVMQRGSNVIMGMVLLATVFCNPIGLDRYYTTLFEFLILFLLPVRLDQSTQAMVEALLKPILSFDFMRGLQEPAPQNLPSQFQNIGVSHSFLINGLFPLLFIGIGYLFMLFSRLQTEGQLIEKNSSSRLKLFFIRARTFMDMSGVLIFCRAYFGQLFFCSLLFIAYYNPSYTTADMIIPSFTFLFSLSIVVKFYNTFTYDIRDQQPKKSDIEALNLERRLRHEYGFAATFVPVELHQKPQGAKVKVGVNLEDPDERKAFYESLDFFSEYKRQQEARANAVVSDYEVESLKYDKRYRPILLEIKMEKFLNRLYRLADLVSALLQIFLICCMQSAVIYQLIGLISFELLLLAYFIKTRPYISKLQNCWLIGNRFMRLSVMIILTIFAIDDAKWMFSKYTRFRVLDCMLLRNIVLVHFFFNSIYMLYGIGMKLPHLWRFFFNKRYYEMMLKMLNPHVEPTQHPDATPDSEDLSKFAQKNDHTLSVDPRSPESRLEHNKRDASKANLVVPRKVKIRPADLRSAKSIKKQ